MDTEYVLSRLRSAQGEDESGLFTFYERLLRLLSSHKAKLPPYPTSSDLPPLLQWDFLKLTGDEFYGWVNEVARLWETREPGTLDELALLSPAELLQSAEVWYQTGTSAHGSIVDALLANALTPYLKAAAEVLQDDIPAGWKQPYCPICKGYPDMARYNERRARYHCICERCATTWTFIRQSCIFCGEIDEERRGFYSSEDDLYRIMVCDSCGFYIKVINDRIAAQMRLQPVLEAERLLTPGLDLMAVQEGYSRPLMLAM